MSVVKRRDRVRDQNMTTYADVAKRGLSTMQDSPSEYPAGPVFVHNVTSTVTRQESQTRAKSRQHASEQIWSLIRDHNVQGLQRCLDCLHPISANFPTTTNFSTHTLLTYAIVYGTLEMVRMFIDAGVDVNQREIKYNDTPLMLACRRCDIDVVRLLLQAGADPNLWTMKYTALTSAICRNFVDIANLLLVYGADIRALTQHGLAPPLSDEMQRVIDQHTKKCDLIHETPWDYANNNLFPETFSQDLEALFILNHKLVELVGEETMGVSSFKDILEFHLIPTIARRNYLTFERDPRLRN